MKRRVLVLPIAAAVIALLTAYKLTRTYTAVPVDAGVTVNRLAPPIELLDQKKPSELVRLAAHQGREPVLIVFFDGEKGAAQSPVLARIREEYPKLRQAGVVVLSVSTALPQQNRAAIESAGPFPFPLLSDPDLSVHRSWGRIDKSGKPLTGFFVVDRAGNVPWSDLSNAPRPEADGQQQLDSLIQRLVDAN